MPQGVAVCGACLVDPPAFEHALAAVHYAYPWDGLITRFKFEGHLDLAAALTQRMLSVMPVHDQAWQARSVLVPVPLSPVRLRERGYNQSWELARRLARRVTWSAQPQLLLRVKEGPHQLGLALHERATNVRGAFLVEPRLRAGLQGQAVILVDDVMTTGATANEAARVLLQAGAASVRVWVLARTPRSALA